MAYEAVIRRDLTERTSAKMTAAAAKHLVCKTITFEKYRLSLDSEIAPSASTNGKISIIAAAWRDLPARLRGAHGE